MTFSVRRGFAKNDGTSVLCFVSQAFAPYANISCTSRTITFEPFIDHGSIFYVESCLLQHAVARANVTEHIPTYSGQRNPATAANVAMYPGGLLPIGDWTSAPGSSPVLFHHPDFTGAEALLAPRQPSPSPGNRHSLYSRSSANESGRHGPWPFAITLINALTRLRLPAC